jgi:hypothetical protein
MRIYKIDISNNYARTNIVRHNFLRIDGLLLCDGTMIHKLISSNINITYSIENFKLNIILKIREKLYKDHKKIFLLRRNFPNAL